MMKLAFALAVLLYFCYSAPVSRAQHNPNLNNEMIDAMNKLNRSVSFPSGFRLSYPGKQMIRNAGNCVIPFIRGLKEVLRNAIVPEHSKHRIEGLEANLQALELAQGNITSTNATCNMPEKSNNSLPFNQYIHFMKKLNSSSSKKGNQ